MTSRNEELFTRAQRTIPGGVNSPVRAFRSVGGTPRFLKKASGARVWDADGKEYLDYVGSWGPAILGHADPVVVEAIPAVREWLLPVQRQIGAEGCVVAEGRDIGTRVFPEADVKFFLEADAEVRATRRHRELVAAGHSVQFDQTKRDMTRRDDRDRSRTVAPLIPAPDAERIDTSSMPAEAVVEHMLAVITARL